MGGMQGEGVTIHVVLGVYDRIRQTVQPEGYGNYRTQRYGDSSVQMPFKDGERVVVMSWAEYHTLMGDGSRLLAPHMENQSRHEEIPRREDPKYLEDLEKEMALAEAP
ncbi:MAG: hypothetical protein HYW25_04960 [Candidatus Aenigmarchaeota archaeon]|nr:hypothetical protein [Candidatus Aenigmarchaeota archaeon]